MRDVPTTPTYLRSVAREVPVSALIPKEWNGFLFVTVVQLIKSHKIIEVMGFLLVACLLKDSVADNFSCMPKTYGS